MTYIISNTQALGKQWAKKYLTPDEKYKILSTSDQIRGKIFVHEDDIYINTQNTEIIMVLLPACCGCRFYCHQAWLSQI